MYATAKQFGRATKKLEEAVARFIDFVNAVEKGGDEEKQQKTVEFAEALIDALEAELIARLMLLPFEWISQLSS